MNVPEDGVQRQAAEPQGIAACGGFVLVGDEVDDAAGDDDRLSDRLAFELTCDRRNLLGGFDERLLGGVLVDLDGATHFAKDLDGNLYDADLAFGGVVFWPVCERDAVRVSEDRPELFGEVRRVGREHEDERFCGGFGDFVELGEMIDEDHHLRDRRIEAEIFDVFADFADGLVADHLGLGIARDVGDALVELVFFAWGDEELPAFGEEAVDAGDAGCIPRLDLIERAHEHLIEAQRVGAEIAHDIVGVDDIAARFGHLFDLHGERFAGALVRDRAVAVFLDVVDVDISAVLILVGISEYHALVEELLERLFGVDKADVVEDFVPEACIEEMEHGVFRAADIEIDGHPVFFVGFAERGFVVIGVDIAEIVPAGASPLGHGVGFAGHIADIEPFCDVGERGFACSGGRVALNFGEHERELLFGKRMMLVVFVPEDGERLAPVTLARKEPVAELVVDGSLADMVCLEPFDHFLFAIGHVEAIEEAGIDMEAVAGERLFGEIAAADDFDDGEIEGFCKVVVAGVVAGNAHDGASAVGRENIVGNPDRGFLVVDWIDRISAGENAGLCFREVGALEVGFLGCGIAVGFDGGFLGVGDDRFHERVFRRENEEGCAKEGIWARGEDADLAVDGRFRGESEIDFGTEGTADPVALHGFDALRPVEFVEVVEEAFGIRGDLEHPLAHGLADDFIAADFGFAVDDFFVREDGSKCWAPVDGGFRDVREAAFVELQEDPLGPLIIVGIRRVDLAIPVVTEAEGFDLTLEIGDVGFGGDARVCAGLDGVLLGRKAESVPADGVQDIKSVHALVTRDDVACGIAFGVADMQPLPRGIGEHVEDVVFGF